jgi:hypothetical protein
VFFFFYLGESAGSKGSQLEVEKTRAGEIPWRGYDTGPRNSWENPDRLGMRFYEFGVSNSLEMEKPSIESL